MITPMSTKTLKGNAIFADFKMNLVITSFIGAAQAKLLKERGL